MRAKGAVAVVVLTLLSTMIPSRAATHPPDRIVIATYTQARGVIAGNGVTMLREPAVTQVSRVDEDRVRISGTTELGDAVALDGVSLTVASVAENSFEVALIPTTVARTTLAARAAGWPYNLEADVISKTVVHYLERQRSS